MLPPSGGMLPPSGGMQTDDQAAMAPADPTGNRVGSLSGVSLPRPRPPEAGPAAFAPGLPDLQAGESGGNEPGFGPAGPRGLAAALGLDPDATKTALAALAGGLSNVKNSPFAGQVAANAAGGALAGGNQAEDTAINQALKLRQIQGRSRNPSQIAMAGNGTLQTPYQPATADDYAKIPSDAHYRYWDGSIRRKGPLQTDVTNGAR
jgi:hypothetical protein